MDLETQNKIYLQAVKNGDEQKAFELLFEVAICEGFGVLAWHGTKQFDFTVFDVGNEGGAHFGSYEQAKMRCGKGEVRPFFLNLGRCSKVRDKGQFKKIPRDADSIMYLNRFEGVSLDTVLNIASDKLDRMTDREFLKNVPEAVYSYAVKNSWQIKSATFATYDVEGNVIPLLYRFDKGEDFRGNIDFMKMHNKKMMRLTF